MHINVISKPKMNAQSVSLEHLDPINHTLICGLRNNHNEILATVSYNARKTNRFVPYRVCDYSAPVTFGDIGEFLIEDTWTACEFGGDIWWAESNRIGNACTMPKPPEQCSKAGKLGGKAAAITQRQNGQLAKFSEAGTRAVSKRVRVTVLATKESAEYVSVNEASKHYPVSRRGLGTVLDGKRPHCKGHHAQYV